ncbi:LexA family transcriptional regulator [Corallococcus sp. AS-1-6]|uniref:LexA family protein n=1 Tax=Corallococcus sp. AS-1-6 TaxID=2874599 RepID=UPI001CBBFDFB|nr:hypothetical protein [Corallococcus sp. AS-1-6]MBZ4371449.1 hypothetical protein [Corallococcus sp. AS-1-6]
MSCPKPPRTDRGGAPNVVTTERQDDVLAFIAQHLQERGFAPTSRDISEHFGWASHTAAVCHLDALKAKHLVTWVPDVARTLQLTEAGRDIVARRQAQQQAVARHA